jgi:D-glycero-alpha-D-manno-heptose-7-phosphate kinase
LIVVRTPFRLPLGGGGTDLPSYYKKYEGFLITAAINKYMFININEPALVNKIKINYSKVEILEMNDIDSIKHEIVRECLRYLKISRPIEIGSMADLSAGTGMGSSSSYTVGLLRGLNAMLRRNVSTQELAEEACKVEIELIKKPIGKQDQYAAAFGGIIVMEIDQLGEVKVSTLNIDHETVYELENRLMMFHTNIERDANTILAEQSQKIETSRENDAVKSMHRIKEIGYEIKDALLGGDVTRFGLLLHEHWLQKRKISTKMSDPRMDSWYEKALQNGAIGGKLMGAGGGGFFLFCSHNGKRKQLRSAMEAEGLRFMDFRFDWEGSKVLVNF